MGTMAGAAVSPAAKRRRAAAWLPTSEAGCPEWYRYDLGVTTTPDIARWLDLSGQFNHMPQDVAANKPALNGRALEFEAANDERLVRAAIAGIDDGYTLGIALRFRTLTSSFQVVIANGGGADGLDLRASPINERRTAHVGVGSRTWGAATTNPETWIARHSGVGGSADFCLNGAHQTPQALGNNIAPTTGFALGSVVAGGAPADVDIYAIIAYSDRKSDAVVDNMSAYLTALRDGTTLPSWRPTDETNLVPWLERPDLWAGSHVSAWANQGTVGAARDIAQAVAARRLVLIPGGNPAGGPALHSDGVDDYLRGTWTQAQPTHLFTMAVVSHDGVAGSTCIDGSTVNARRVYTGTGADVRIFAGGAVAPIVVADPKQWHRVEALYNGASSKLRVDDLAPNTGNLGVAASGGLIVGMAQAPAVVPAESLIAEIFEYDNVLGAAAQNRAHAYMTREYGI